jgi:hypothetical protein
VDTRQLARVPGRKKTDPVDYQWIQRLHSCGLLLGSFRRKYEGLSCVFSSASQSAACEVEQIRLSRPTPNIIQSQCFNGSGPYRLACARWSEG